MADLLPIRDISLEAVRGVVRDALCVEGGSELLANYIASVDWSTVDEAAADVPSLLGKLEGLCTAFDEGDIALPRLLDELIRLLPANEPLALRFVVGATEMTVVSVPPSAFTVVEARDDQREGLSALRPRTALSIRPAALAT